MLPPTEQQKQEVLYDIYYEIGQFVDCVKLTQERQIGANINIGVTMNQEWYSKSLALINAILESRLLHERNLLDFFWEPNRQKDDILAVDYDFESGAFTGYKDYKERLHKNLVHLTYSRSQHRAERKVVWPNNEALPLLEQSRKFVKHLLANYLPNLPGDACKEILISWSQDLQQQIKALSGDECKKCLISNWQDLQRQLAALIPLVSQASD